MELTRAARFYYLSVVLAACAVVTFAAWGLSLDAEGLVAFACLTALAYVSASWASKSSSAFAHTSVGNVALVAAAILLGPKGAALAVLVTLTTKAAGDGWTKKAFNGAQLVLTVTAAGEAAQVLSSGTSVADMSLGKLLLVGLVADLVCCATNAVLVAGIVSLTRKLPLVAVLQSTMLPQAPSYLGYGLYGVMLSIWWVLTEVGPVAIFFVIIPLWLARWAYVQYAEQQLAYDRTIRTLVQAVEVKDAYTRGHSERVAAASVLIAGQLGMAETRLESLRYAGILHDVGKLGVPTRLLQKTGRLSDDEFDTIKLHPLRGLEMVRGIEFLQEAYEGILHHHERVDGRGYPLGLSGTDIPEFARIIGVADAFDAMTTTRSYRGARPVDEALEELRRCAGDQFDPDMVAALEKAVGQVGWQPEVSLVDLPSATLPHQPTARDHDDPSFTTNAAFTPGVDTLPHESFATGSDGTEVPR